MSLKSYKWAWSMPTQSASERLVLLALSERSNKHMQCWPSQRCLATDTGMNIKTIGKTLKILEQKGMILDVGRLKSRNGFIKIYRLNTALKPTQSIKNGLGKTNKNEPHQTKTEAFDSPAPHPIDAEKCAPKCGERATQNVNGAHTQSWETEPPINESLKNPKKKSYKKNFEANEQTFDFSTLPESIDPQAVQNFIDHRQALKTPLTQHALEIQMREAAKATALGLTPEEAIDQTILACWKSINLTWLQTRMHQQANPGQQTSSSGGWENYDPNDTSWISLVDLSKIQHAK